MSFKHMLRANKNELLSLALAGFLIMNSGFTAPHEVIEDTSTKVEEEAAPVAANNAPTAISVSENGSIALASEEQKAQFGLIETGADSAMKLDADEDDLYDDEEDVYDDDDDVYDDEDVDDVDDDGVYDDDDVYDDDTDVDDYSTATVEEASMIEDYNYVEEPQYAAVMAMEATAYLPTDGDGYGVTAMGIPATYGVAAVDPSVIPLGSRLYVPGYGEAIAADTGGAINGYRIDLCMESYDQAMSFGRRVITVYVLD